MAETYHILERRPDPLLLSIVIPMYNEEEVMPILRPRLTALLDRMAMPVEVVLVNDGSRDLTLKYLHEWALGDRRIRVVSLARNFGHQAALTAGLNYARGEAVVSMDADMQDPPEVVLEMVEKYREGYDVVYGQRRKRTGETIFKLASAWLFYRFMRLFIYKDLPTDVGDFRLMSRPCLDVLLSMRETNRFLRGMVSWVGFAQTFVQYDRSARAAGTTKYPLRKMVKFAATAAISFSPAPLRAIMLLGVITGLLGLGVGAYAVLVKLLGIYAVPGWASTIVVVCLVGSEILFGLGMVGEYVGRIYDESKGRPLYVVAKIFESPPHKEKP